MDRSGRAATDPSGPGSASFQHMTIALCRASLCGVLRTAPTFFRVMVNLFIPDPIVSSMGITLAAALTAV